MTESEWLDGNDLRRMVHFARASRVSDRKLRLFAVACCRRIDHALPDRRSRNAIDVAERAAEGLATGAKLHLANRAAHQAILDAQRCVGKIGSSPASTALYVTEPNAALAARRVANWVQTAVVGAARGDRKLPAPHTDAQIQFLREIRFDAAAMARAAELQPDLPILLRDVCGNLFRPVNRNAVWLTSTVSSLAQAIYDEQAFERMPVLADALEDAGCANADVLNHCRLPGVHVRGCWVIDKLLGKE